MMLLSPRSKISSDRYRSDDPISIVVVGLGAMGQKNVAHLMKSPSYRIVGVFDVNKNVGSDVASRSESRQYSSFEEVIDDDVQAIFVCTPHYLLAEYGMRVLEGGKHLLIEKPMAIAVSEADALIALSREKGLMLSVNYSMAYTEVIQNAASLISEGVVGFVNSIDIRWNNYKNAGYYQGVHSPTPDDWRLLKSKSGGGMLIMTTCHALHYSTFLTGLVPLRATAVTQITSQGGDVEHMLNGLVEYSSGVSGTISTSSNQRGSAINDTTIAGSNGTLVICADELKFYSTRIISGSRPGKWHSQKFKRSEVHFDKWLDDTARAIDCDGDLSVDPIIARNSLALIDALYQSARNNETVDVEQID